MFKKFFKIRFELFFVSIIAILFGSILFPDDLFSNVILPILFIINIFSGLFIFSNSPRHSRFTIIILALSFIAFLVRLITKTEDDLLNYLKLIIYFAFYLVMTYEIVRQVWSANSVNKGVIFGLMSGYVSLGLLGFFTFLCIELLQPNSFSGFIEYGAIDTKVDTLLYYSFVTLMTIGFGDVIPISDIAQKTSILLAMFGQFYLVIVTAVVIEKYIRHSHKVE